MDEIKQMMQEHDPEHMDPEMKQQLKQMEEMMSGSGDPNMMADPNQQMDLSSFGKVEDVTQAEQGVNSNGGIVISEKRNFD